MWTLMEYRLLSWSSVWCTAAWRTRCIKQGGGRELSATMIGSQCPMLKVKQSDDILLCISESGKKVMNTRNNTIHEFCRDYKCHPLPLKYIHSRIWAESSRSKRLHIQFGWLLPGTVRGCTFTVTVTPVITEIKKSIIISEHGTDRSPEKVKKIFSTMQKILCIPVHG